MTIDTEAAVSAEESSKGIKVKLGPRVLNTTLGSYGTMPATVIAVGTRVPADQSWCTSPDEEFVFIMQSDGNLVQYRVIGNPPAFAPGVEFTGEDVWSAGTATGAEFVVQADGNLVIYDANKKAVWSSNTAGVPAGLYVQDDRNIVLYKIVPSWSTIR